MINKETDSILQSKQQSYNLMTYCYLSKIPVNWSNGDFNQLYCKSDMYNQLPKLVTYDEQICYAL